ncbi:MAG: hypothetical protein HZB24_02275, partial [Desulfobacterales bacterium]|nr:hypothetical protein [Desulfobacterales bacterium]
EENLLRELERYDAEDAARVCAWIRQEADLEPAVDHWISIYRSALSDAKKMQDGRDRSSDMRAAADYLRFLSEKIKSVQQIENAKNESEAALMQQQAFNEELLKKIETFEAELKAIKGSISWRLLGYFRGMKAWLRAHSGMGA